MSRPRLLLVTRNFPPAKGGIETMAWELASRAPGAGIDLAVLHIGQKACASPPSGVAYHHVPAGGNRMAWLVSAVSVPWAAWRHGAGRVFHMQMNTGLGGIVARALLGIPYVVLGLGMELLPGRPGLLRALRARVLRGATRVVSISRFTDGLAAACGADRRVVVNPGTRSWPSWTRDRARVFGEAGEGTFVCLSLSRLVPRKGIDVAIEALALVLALRKDILWCIAGSGPDRPRLEALSRERGVEGHLRFLGEVRDKDMADCFASADLFVLPCRESKHPPDAEGFGLVFLEAASCGTPSLGGASGGVPDAIVDGETGYLVDPTDAKALAARILRLMDDRAELRRLGEAARARSLEQSWEKAGARYYAAILAPAEDRRA